VVFQEILDRIPKSSLSSPESKQIRGALTTLSRSQNSNSQMVLMIFRFFIQSGEYKFFIKRLKNVIGIVEESDLVKDANNYSKQKPVQEESGIKNKF